MKNFIDREPVNPNRKKITFEADPVSGVNYATVEFADSAPVDKLGTSLNRAMMMALQTFYGNTVEFGSGTITETNSDGDTLVTTFVGGSPYVITSVFTSGTMVMTKTTTFNLDGTISEVIS